MATETKTAETSTEIAIVTSSTIVDVSKGYTSIVGADFDTRKKLFNVMNGALSLRDHLGEEIAVVDLVALPIAGGIDTETGQVKDDYTRYILITPDGTAYSASSSGVGNSLNQMVALFGEPANWPAEGITVVAREEKSKKNSSYRFVALDIV